MRVNDKTIGQQNFYIKYEYHLNFIFVGHTTCLVES